MLPVSLKVIEDRAFSHNDPTEQTLPDKTISIGNSTFTWSDIETIDRPASLTTPAERFSGGSRQKR